MSDNDNLKLYNVEITEDEKNKDKYVIHYDPLPYGSQEIILSKKESGEGEIGRADAKNTTLSVDKKILGEQAYAYIRMKEGEKYGTAVRILTYAPVISRIILLPEGKVTVVVTDLNSYTSQAGLDIRIYEGTNERADIHLEKDVRQFDLAQAGIAYDEKIKFDMHICFHMIDSNGTYISGPPSVVEVALNPPAVKQIVREEKEIELELSEESDLQLYANIYENGNCIYSLLTCDRKEGNKLVIATDKVNMTEGSYALALMAMNSQAASYLSALVPLITTRPMILSSRLDDAGWIIRMKESGYYYWQGQYGWTDEIQINTTEEPEIRYADQCNGTVTLGPTARITETSQDGFFPKDGYYYRHDRENEHELSEKYTNFDNDSFTIEESDGKWKLCVKEGARETVEKDFKKLMLSECTTYAQTEELAGCFGEMLLRAEDMLSVRYGYEPNLGTCDIRAGMMLCFDYAEYQNIPEVNRETAEKESLSDRNLSGFVGNGNGVFRSILRDGKITFEPFAQDAVKNGRLTVEPPQIDVDGRIGMGTGIWDTLYEQFQAPFVKLMYPSVWKQSEHANHGSMYYYDNICLAAADSYDKLEKAAENFRNELKPSEDAAYVCFRGRTTVKILIHIFVEGNPQTCALGSTLGDIIAAYGLGSNIILERIYDGQYVPFAAIDTRIPLYIGDRICSR